MLLATHEWESIPRRHLVQLACDPQFSKHVVETMEPCSLRRMGSSGARLKLPINLTAF